MTIEQIKKILSILTVLSHYQLKPNSNGMLCCPFHEDQQASMRVYDRTNTVYCFAGGCSIESLDVIDFIMEMEKLTKRAAILKAKSLCTISSTKNKKAVLPKMEKVENPQVAFKKYHKSLHSHRASKEYCESRCLDWRLLEIGYKSRQTTTRWARGCIIFPLLDTKGNIVSLYGRGIKGSSHYYQSERSGLYPGYPPRSTKQLILTESIIDAATLETIDLGLEHYEVLALYGTNGMTEEHMSAIKSLVDLEEIIFALDADWAGEEALKKYELALRRVHPKVKMSKLELPDGEDVNSMAMSHEHYKDMFVELMRNRLSLEGEQVKSAVVKVESYLDTSDAYNLHYQTATASYYVKGGIKSGLKDLSSMKVMLVVQNGKGKKSRNGIDLYEDRQIEKLARHVSDRLGLRADLVELDLHALADELEKYRKELQRSSGKVVQVSPMSVDEKAAALKFWKSKDLMKMLDEQLEAYGIIGEYNNRRLGFCIASSSQMKEPLHGLIQGSSGSGKTHLLSSLCSLIPAENYLSITRATDNSFYNYGAYDLKNKLISIEDKDSMSEEANLAFRELQSKGMVALSTTGQDEKGHNRSYVKEVFGPIASLACTTKGELYLDDMNRCFLLAVDESEAQTNRILSYQKKRAAGQVRGEEKERIQQFMQQALRMLKAYEVVIPQATKINLPEDVKDKRRLNSLYLSLVKQITLLHQYQRKKNDSNQLLATKEDLKIANEIMFDAIVLKVDDLHGPIRSFYEKLKKYIKEVGGQTAKEYSFKQRELRQYLRLSKSSVIRNVRELLELEYIKISGGSERIGLHYQISYWDDNEALRSRIKKWLSDQISKL